MREHTQVKTTHNEGERFGRNSKIRHFEACLPNEYGFHLTTLQSPGLCCLRDPVFYFRMPKVEAESWLCLPTVCLLCIPWRHLSSDISPGDQAGSMHPTGILSCSRTWLSLSLARCHSLLWRIVSGVFQKGSVLLFR